MIEALLEMPWFKERKKKEQIVNILWISKMSNAKEGPYLLVGNVLERFLHVQFFLGWTRKRPPSGVVAPHWGYPKDESDKLRAAHYY